MQGIKSFIYRLIKRSENYTKTDMVYVAKNGFWMTAGQFTSVAIILASSIVFGLFLPKEVYGQYKFILSIVSVLGALSLSGLGTAVTQAVASGKEGVFKDSIRVTLKWGLIIFSVSILLSIYYSTNGNPDLAVSILISGLCTPIINAFGLISSFFAGKKDFMRSTGYALTQQIITTSILIVVSIFIHNAFVLIAVNFLSASIINYFVYIVAMNKWRPNEVHDDSYIDHGKNLSYMNFISTLANQLDKILVFHWIGAVELAIYSFAIAIPEQIKGSYKNLFNIALPKMSVVDRKTLRHSVLDKFYRLSGLSVLIILVYYFISPYVYELLFPKYIDSILYSQIYIIGLVFVPGIALFSMYFQVLKDKSTLYKLNLISNIATIIFALVLIYFFGVWGAIIENSISWLFMFIVNLFFFLKEKDSL